MKNDPSSNGEALQHVVRARMLRSQKEKLSITDGPFAETKERLGALTVLKDNVKHESRTEIARFLRLQRPASKLA